MEEVFRGMWVIAYRELLRFAQDRSRMLSSFGMPLLFLIIFGAGFNQIIGALTPGVDFIKFIYPGIIAMTVLMTSVFSGLSVVWDREFGFLKEVLVAPLSRSGIVLGKAAGGASVAVMQGFIMLVIAPFVGITLTPMLVIKLIPLLIIISLSLSGLGILIASRMRSQQGFHIIVQLIVFPTNFPVRHILPGQQCADVAPGYFQGQPANLWRRRYPPTLPRWRPGVSRHGNGERQLCHWRNGIRTYHEHS